MKGVSFITDETNKRHFVQIDLKAIEKHEEEIHDLIDVLVAESRRVENSIPWKQVVKSLRKKNNL